MYYKIEDKTSEVYKKLRDMRTEEIGFEEENKTAISEKTGLEWKSYLGNPGQQNWNRVTTYIGFKFTEPEKADPVIWKEHAKHKGIFVPNNRTKKGREMSAFLANDLKGHCFDVVFKTLGIEYFSKFTNPFVEICGETIILYFGEDYEIESEVITEITKREFYAIYKGVEQKQEV